MVIFLAISGSLFHNLAVQKVGKALPDASASEIGELIGGSSSKAFQALSEEEKAMVIPEIASALTGIWAFFLAAAALSVVCSIALLVSTRQLNHFLGCGEFLTRELESQVWWWCKDEGGERRIRHALGRYAYGILGRYR